MLSAALFLLASAPQSDLVLEDFEGSNYGSWEVTGTAFGPGPAQGTLPGQMRVTGYRGRGLANTYYKDDTAIGTLTSPEFKISRKYMTFLIGGGKDLKNTVMNLIVDSKVVRQATGPNDRPGGSEELSEDSWNLADLAGKTATIQIVDTATGGWGHINVDHIVLTDTKPQAQIMKRDIKADADWLLIPVKNDAPMKRLTMKVDGQFFTSNDVQITADKPDWWARVSLREFKGKTITLESNRATKALSAIKTGPAAWSKSIYKEPSRGQIHFSPKNGWLNDPNGLVYFKGEYHMFFQHNPYGWPSANKHWGHAVSKDLVHWKEIDDPLAPDELGEMYSGSAVVDHQNSSGLGTAKKPPVVLIYTAAGPKFTQCIASSTDGRTFTKYSGNPRILEVTGGNRDPKVFWHEPSKSWVLLLYVEKGGLHTVHFYRSANLKDWTLSSVLPGERGTNLLYECPDFFELPVSGGAKKWVVMGADGEHLIGSFDGYKFTPESPRLPGPARGGYYAPQTWNDMPDGRRVQVGWLWTETPGTSFNQSMSIPQELRLIATKDGPRLTRTPIKELEKLRVREFNGVESLSKVAADVMEIVATSGDADFKIRGLELSLKGGVLSVGGIKAPIPKLTDLHIFVDRTCLEIFVDQGKVYLPYCINLAPKNRSISVKGDVKDVKVFELKSIWK